MVCCHYFNQWFQVPLDLDRVLVGVIGCRGYLSARFRHEALDLYGFSRFREGSFSQALHEGVDHRHGLLSPPLHLIKNLQEKRLELEVLVVFFFYFWIHSVRRVLGYQHYILFSFYLGMARCDHGALLCTSGITLEKRPKQATVLTMQ